MTDAGAGPPAEDDGALEELDLTGFASQEPPKEGRARRVEDTRARIAFALLGILALVLVGLLLLLGMERINVEELIKLLGVMLAPLVGLVGAATGYYYGRNS